MFGFSFTGARLNRNSTGPWIGWIACISLPLGVLASFVGLVVWPLEAGGGLEFGDELCSVGLELAWPSCSSTAWPAVFGLAIAVALTCAVVRAEVGVLRSDPASHPILDVLPAALAALIAIYAASGHLRFASHQLAQWRQEHFIDSLNLWLPLAMLVAMVAACGLRGGRFGLATALALIWVLPASPADLSEPRPEPLLGENCYGPACHIQ
jgi:hypothetical protein